MNQGVYARKGRLRTILSTKNVKKRAEREERPGQALLLNFSSRKFPSVKSITYREERQFHTNLSTEIVGKSKLVNNCLLQQGNIAAGLPSFYAWKNIR
jgi:hypothetical protein